MNKSTIGNYLCILAGGVLIGFLLCFYSGSKEEENFYGVEQEKILLDRIDSLRTTRSQSEVRIDTIIQTKYKLRTKYERDTIYLNSMDFDSIKVLFNRTYPK